MSTKKITRVLRTNRELKSKKMLAASFEFTIAIRAKWGIMISAKEVSI